MKNEGIKVLLADDHELIREGLKRIISFEEDIRIVGEASNGLDVLDMLKVFNPDIILLDFNMPKMDGLEVLKNVKAKNKSIKIIMLTMENNAQILKEAIRIGADGYILKESAGEQVVDAIYDVLKGEQYIDQSLVSILFSSIRGKEHDKQLVFKKLTKRELDVLYYISEGYSNKEIGEKLFLAEKTIKNYATNVFKKLGVKDRVHATIFAMEHNIKKYYNDKI